MALAALLKVSHLGSILLASVGEGSDSQAFQLELDAMRFGLRRALVSAEVLSAHLPDWKSVFELLTQFPRFDVPRVLHLVRADDTSTSVLRSWGPPPKDSYFVLGSLELRLLACVLSRCYEAAVEKPIFPYCDRAILGTPVEQPLGLALEFTKAFYENLDLRKATEELIRYAGPRRFPNPEAEKQYWSQRSQAWLEAFRAACQAIDTDHLPSEVQPQIQLFGLLNISASHLPERRPPHPDNKEGVHQLVYFGTNRRPMDMQGDVCEFSADHDDVTHYGVCDVYVPESFVFGGPGFWRVVARALGWTGDRLELERCWVLEKHDYWRQMSALFEGSLPQEKVALVYLHGYNVAFRDAARHAAQLAFDLKVPGVTSFFSWPSKGRRSQYMSDEDAIQASERQITEYIVSFVAHSGASKIHLLAHSMGNRGLLRAVQRIAAKAEQHLGISFGQIILAAADVDTNQFRELAPLYPRLAKRTTMYVSGKDLALRSSGILHANDRAGFVPPITTIKGIDTVVVSQVDLSLLGHGFFRAAEPVLNDMHILLRYDTSPQERVRLIDKCTDDGRNYWEFRP